VTPDVSRKDRTVPAPTPTTGNPLVNVLLFGVFVAATLFAVFRAARSNRTASDYYTGGQGLTGAANGVALTGDYLSAAAFLGVIGAVAVAGHDGVTFALGSLVGWVVALLLLSERMRNTGRYTMGDVLGFRTDRRRVRAAAATSTVLISLLYLIAQIAGAGGLFALLLGIPNTDRGAQSLVIAFAGLLMIVYVLVGGMRGTTAVQILKAGLLIAVTTVVAVWVLGRYGFNVSRLLGDAVEANPRAGEALLAPGVLYGSGTTANLDFFSLSIAGLLGPASLPHILMRFYTVPDAREARRSTTWAIWLIGGFFLLAIVIGFGAAALVGPAAIVTAPGGSNSAAPLLAFRLGGEVLLGLVAAVAFATILAVVAGLTITASTSFAHDVYATVLRRGGADPASEVRVARITALVVGVLATLGGIAANGQNTAVLIGLAFAIAASANLPALLLTLYWPRFTTTGLLWSMYGGALVAIVLVVFSPAVTGSPTAVFPDVDIAWFPLANPGLVSVPVSFLLAVLGTHLGPRGRQHRAAWAEMEVRAALGPVRPATDAVAGTRR
jgi:cation/acetate symporter